MPELDLIWMSAVIFVPSLFALGLLFSPRGTEEWMRWWCLLGTAVTLVVSLCIFIDFNKMIDMHRGNAVDASLLNRHNSAEAAEYNLGDPKKTGVRQSNDLIARYPWIGRFHIDYYLGIDGISMALVLLTTLICFLA